MNDPSPRGFLLPHDFRLPRLIKQLGGESHCLVDDSARFSLTFYDSFDWRLHAAGLRLSRISTVQGSLLRLRSSDGVDVVEPVELIGEPAWPAELPEGDLKNRVLRLLDMRVLLPLATIDGEVTEMRLLNDDAKTVVRLQNLQLHSTAPEIKEPRALWPRLRLLSLKGYEGDFDALAEKLANEFEWPSAPECLFDEAMASVGREAGDYSSKLKLSLRAEQMAIKAVRKILLTLLDTLERNIPGARADLDSEFLHDLRVATRRTRSALSQIKRVLPDAVVAEYKTRFAWVGQITGPVRDLDVFLLELPHYRASLPTVMAGDLDALEEHLRAAHQTEQARLKRKLGSAEMKTLLDDWRNVLEGDLPLDQAGWFADLPIGQVASQRIWKMYRKTLKAGRAVTPDDPPEAMHELRKDCKKLRYLIEFFRSLYDAKDVKAIIRVLKDLLDNLGDYQDLVVQADKLRAFAAELNQDDPGHLPTVLAIGGLIADLLRRQQLAHERFAERFEHFDSKENRARCKRLFKEQAEVLG
ncbi:CHAD domain-containing protein [Thiosocius teredinicola]|uniref:CHAD domain-containing protein n=1 Tax=Thiosocius teredinicola TaxID=1973002 RepID=UPI00099139B1